MDKLVKTYPMSDDNGDVEHWQSILLGLAISFIQRRYFLTNPTFDDLKINKCEFNQYMKDSVNISTDETIAAYLISIACEKLDEIIKQNDLSDIQIQMMTHIHRSTVQWLNEIGNSVNGQYQLLNTISMDEAAQIATYKNKSADCRLLDMAECKTGFRSFLDYLWKIMLNISQEMIHNETDISDHMELFDPSHYIVPSINEYICFNFPEDKYVNQSVILPSVGKQLKGAKRKIVERMLNLSSKPGKWFIENSKLVCGKNYYNYSTANVNENPTIADLGIDTFYIECMDCITIDEGEWSEKDACCKYIFLEECVKEVK